MNIPQNPNGEANMAGSQPVVIASDQSAVPVTVSGVSTAAKQDTGNTSLGTIAGAVAGSEMQVDVVTLPALPAGNNNIGDVDVASLPALPAGNNNIGDVDVASIAAGDNNIGNVDVVTLPADPLGANADAVVAAGAAGSISAKLRAISRDIVANIVLAAGTNNIGDVDVASIAAGDNNIGNVDIVTVPADPFGANADAAVAAGATGSISAKLRSISRDIVANIVLAAGSNAIGKLAANSGVDIGDVDVTSVNAFVAHDSPIAGNPLIMGGVASAAAPASVSADQDAVRAWYLRNGAAATVLTAAGALIGGDATNGLDVDVTRMAALVAGSAEIGFIKVASGSIASGAVASGAVASGAFASGSIASGAIASGAIAAGAIAAGATSIATTEDTASAAADHLVKVAAIRRDTPVADDNTNADGDYTQFKLSNFGKLWVAGTVLEDTAHIAGEPIMQGGVRRIDTPATSAGSSGDWATMDASAEGALWATLTPTTTGGLSVANFTSGDTYTALTNSAQVIKASAGNLYGYYIYNPNAVASYVLLYNIAAASVTVGTSTALLVFCIPATSGANLMFPYPIGFSNAGWSIAATTTGGGNTAPTTALEAMIWYK